MGQIVREELSGGWTKKKWLEYIGGVEKPGKDEARMKYEEQQRLQAEETSDRVKRGKPRKK